MYRVLHTPGVTQRLRTKPTLPGKNTSKREGGQERGREEGEQTKRRQPTEEDGERGTKRKKDTDHKTPKRRPQHRKRRGGRARNRKSAEDAHATEKARRTRKRQKGETRTRHRQKRDGETETPPTTLPPKLGMPMVLGGRVTLILPLTLVITHRLPLTKSTVRSCNYPHPPSQSSPSVNRARSAWKGFD